MTDLDSVKLNVSMTLPALRWAAAKKDTTALPSAPIYLQQQQDDKRIMLDAAELIEQMMWLLSPTA